LSDDDDAEEGSSSVTASSVAAAAALANGSSAVPSTSRAVQDADADDLSDSDADDTWSKWSCPDFVWHPARHELPELHQFTGNMGMNVDVSDFSTADF